MPRVPTRSPLDDIRIAAPCSADWDRMEGDERARFCRQCDKHVYDLSAMTRAEAEALLASSPGACVRLYRRTDGRVLTSDCSVGVTRRRRRRRVVAVAAAASAALAAVSAAFAAGRPEGGAPEPVRVRPIGDDVRFALDPDEVEAASGAPRRRVHLRVVPADEQIRDLAARDARVRELLERDAELRGLGRPVEAEPERPAPPVKPVPPRRPGWKDRPTRPLMGAVAPHWDQDPPTDKGGST